MSGPQKSGLQVNTQDTPSSVFLDGQYLEKTPFIGTEIKPGTYQLSIQPDDQTLAKYDTTVTLRKGLLTVVTWKPGARPEQSGGITYELEKLDSKQTELSVTSIPDGAIISIDGGAKEFAPALLSDVSPGSHTLTISLPSYETQEHTINAVAGHRLNASVKLARSSSQSQPDISPLLNVATPSADISSQNASGSAVLPGSTGETVLIESTGFVQAGKEVLRVRDTAGPSGAELGFAEVGSSYPYLGETTNGWLKIIFEGKPGWVSGTYATLSQ